MSILIKHIVNIYIVKGISNTTNKIENMFQKYIRINLNFYII